jgi:hypothetical protein
MDREYETQVRDRAPGQASEHRPYGSEPISASLQPANTTLLPAAIAAKNAARHFAHIFRGSRGADK